MYQIGKMIFLQFSLNSAKLVGEGDRYVESMMLVLTRLYSFSTFCVYVVNPLVFSIVDDGGILLMTNCEILEKDCMIILAGYNEK